ncbi:GNAT family N-acetyltransferase [uncultured Pontibacter sp.]|uniref:GNAT family N-acetyltransferase n=1 Tax=uncultured Pontibacter sp. TaxID=453356 RepID=UPI00262C5C4F|nr:GNAT family N-acetyltransferase [uncultured Pontibacter sp.]
MLPVTIRPLAPAELLPMELLLLADPSEEIILSYIHQSHTFIADYNGETAGVLVIQQQGAAAEVMNVAVPEAMQGRGIGRKLVAFAKQWASQQSIKQLSVCTGNSTLPALSLYKSCGFKVESIDEGYFLRNYPEPIM